MRSSKGLVIILSLLVSATCLAQLSNGDSGAQLLTRISYRSTYGMDWREQQGSPQICFALYRSGYYRLSKVTEGGTQGFHGTLSKDQVSLVGKMLKNLDAQSREGGIIRQGAESLVVEIAGKAKRYTWFDADHQDPFPESVVELVRWLQEFKAQGAAPLTLRDLSDEPICPPASAKPVQPTVAGLTSNSPDKFRCGRP